MGKILRKTPFGQSIETDRENDVCKLFIEGKEVLFSIESLKTIDSHKWRIHETGHGRSYVVTCDRRAAGLARLVTDAKPGQIPDHINGNTYDNRIENLLVCDRSLNAQNCRKNKRFMGVAFNAHSSIHPWKARIQKDHKSFSLGCYRTKQEAALVYDMAADILYGYFGYRNFPTLVSIATVRRWIKDLKHHIYSVLFLKKDGELRGMLCRNNVTKYMKGKHLAFDPKRYGLFSTYDLQKKSYRFINLKNVLGISCKGKRCRILRKKRNVPWNSGVTTALTAARES